MHKPPPAAFYTGVLESKNGGGMWWWCFDGIPDLYIQEFMQLTPLQPPYAQAFEAAEVERKSKERDRAKRGRDAKKEKDAAIVQEHAALTATNSQLTASLAQATASLAALQAELVPMSALNADLKRKNAELAEENAAMGHAKAQLAEANSALAAANTELSSQAVVRELQAMRSQNVDLRQSWSKNAAELAAAKKASAALEVQVRGWVRGLSGVRKRETAVEGQEDRIGDLEHARTAAVQQLKASQWELTDLRKFCTTAKKQLQRVNSLSDANAALFTENSSSVTAAVTRTI